MNRMNQGISSLCRSNEKDNGSGGKGKDIRTTELVDGPRRSARAKRSTASRSCAARDGIPHKTTSQTSIA